MRIKGALAHEVPKIFLVSFFFFFLPLHVSMCVCRLNIKFEGKKKRRLQATVIFILTPTLFHFFMSLALFYIKFLILLSRSVPEIVTPINDFLYTKMKRIQC